MTSKFELAPLRGKELVAFGRARARDIAFDAVRKLWSRRKKDGMKQKDLAEILDIGEDRISRMMSAPGNWTFETFGALIAGMGGDFEIEVYEVNDKPKFGTNHAAYDDFSSITPSSSDNISTAYSTDTQNELPNTASTVSIEFSNLPTAQI